MTSKSRQCGAPKEALVAELAHVVVTQEDAEALLHIAEFPRDRIPPFTTPFIYWLKIVDMASHGLLKDGIRPIAHAAMTLFPHNEVFARCLDSVSKLELEPQAALGDDFKESNGAAPMHAAADGKKQQDKRETWNLTLRLDDIPGDRLSEVLEILRKISGDSTITLIRVDTGSTILVLRMSVCTALRIQELLESGELQEMLGLEISGFSKAENSHLLEQILDEDKVYDENVHLVNQFFANGVVSPQDTEGLVRKVFLRYFEKVKSGEQIAEPSKYLIGIARKVAKDWRVRSRRELHGDVGESSLAEMGSTMSTRVGRVHDKEVMREYWRKRAALHNEVGGLSLEDSYERYAPNIMLFFSNKAAAANDIDDLMHTTFLRYIERYQRDEIREPLRFLYRIAHLVLFEYWRERKRIDLHDEVGELSLADLGAGITTLVARDQEKQRVLDALRTLRLDFQVAVELRYWERLSYKEIAEVLDTNPATIGVWLRRGRRQLKKLLDVPDHEPSDDGETSHDEEEAPESEDLTSLMETVRDIASGRDND